jgi:hypothetical protein
VTTGQPTTTSAIGTDHHTTNDSVSWPGTLLHLVMNNSTDDDGAAKHIVQWTNILHNGGEVFGMAISRERRRLTQQPLVFGAIIGEGRAVNIVHGFNIITLDNETHDADGMVGFFLGDRIVLHDNDDTHYQDPQYWVDDNFGNMATSFVGHAASATDCRNAADKAMDKETNRRLLPLGPKATGVNVPKLLPLHKDWWPFFLSDKRSPLETYKWLRTATKAWTSKTEKLRHKRHSIGRGRRAPATQPIASAAA